jgi:uncharacterized protein (TIGR00255 family)
MHSMTGFGRGTHTTDQWLANVEASSINRKQIEIVANLPRSLQSLETKVRQATLPHVSRGRVQISIRLDKPEGSNRAQIRVNPGLARSLESAFSDISLIIGRQLLPTASDFARQAGIIEIGESEEIDLEAAWQAISPALDTAIATLNEMRTSEGKHLQDDFIERLNHLKRHTQIIAEHAPSRPEHQREILLKRLSDMGIKLADNDDRLAKEIALFADRCDISEELTRLNSHFAKFHEYLHSKEACGRPLDFLCQELFREFNTIGSKANDALIAQTVVEAKTELEKIREQVQNIE